MFYWLFHEPESPQKLINEWTSQVYKMKRDNLFGVAKFYKPGSPEFIRMVNSIDRLHTEEKEYYHNQLPKHLKKLL